MNATTEQVFNYTSLATFFSRMFVLQEQNYKGSPVCFQARELFFVVVQASS